LAEKNNLIKDLGNWIIIEAFTKFKELLTTSEEKLILSLNISLHQFMDSSFIPFIKNALKEFSIDPSLIEMEITESVFIVYPDRVNLVLREIKETGISISLDDFGTGYSSLLSLQTLEIDILKLDREFIKEIYVNNDFSFVDEIISIAHKLNINTIAEGVETPYQIEYLHKKGCDYVQGFLFSKPLIFEDAIKYIENYKKKGSPL
jgi:EAL domain-containing protein (putative c-di-GMP-specific phosphodiesterase class I)